MTKSDQMPDPVELRASIAVLMRVFLSGERRFPSAGGKMRYNPHEFQTLDYIRRHGAASPTELARWMDIAPSTMTSITDRMSAANLIVRGRSEKDRRSVTLELTEAGLETANAIFSQDIKNMEAILAALDENEGVSLNELLKKVAASLQKP